MPREAQPPLDAEKSSTPQLLDRFRMPPGFESIARSTLLIGTRGSGKTTYLRYLRHKSEGLALLGDLRRIATSITSDIGAGGLTFELPLDLEPLIRNKTAALLANWVASAAVAQGRTLPWQILQRTLPTGLQLPPPKAADAGVAQQYDLIADAPLYRFDNNQATHHLCDFISEIASREEAGLLILLDRAEEPPYPSLNPIFQLLDQNHPFKTLIATRPGLLGPQHQLSASTPEPGDHYDLRHLGAAPFDPSWRNFQRSVLEAWMPAVSEIPAGELEWLLKIGRDSMRNAIELAYHSRDVEGQYHRAEALRRLQMLRRMLLAASQGRLAPHNDRIRQLLSQIRRSFPSVEHPVRLRLPQKRQQPLPTLPRPLSELTQEQLVVRLALQVGLFTTENGVEWHPYQELLYVEVPALFLWKEGVDAWPDI